MAKPKRKPKPTTQSDDKTTARGAKSGSVSAWSRWRWPLVLVMLIGGGTAAGLFAHRSHTANAEQKREAAIQVAANSAAANVSREARRETQALAGLFDESQMAMLLSSDDAGTRASVEAEIAAAHDFVLLARLLKAGTRTLELTSHPPLGYAAIEILSESEKSGKAPLAEVLLFGSDDQHILTVWRINEGGALVGHLVLALDVSLLPAIMAKVSIPDGYAELVQRIGGGKPLVLSRGGDSGLRQGPTGVRAEVEGTPWHIAFWPGGRLTPPPPLMGLPEWAIPAAGGSLIAIILLTVAARQRAHGRALAAAEEAQRKKQRAAATKRAAGAVAAVAAAAPGEGVKAAVASPGASSPEASGAADEEAGAMDMPAEIFRAYDIRGVVGGDSTPKSFVRSAAPSAPKPTTVGSKPSSWGAMVAIPVRSCRAP